MKKYWTVAVLGWQDSLVYRLNALIWVLYAVLPSLTLMLVWIAAYSSEDAEKNGGTIGGLNLSQMMTYYLCVTALSVAITPHPEWDMATQIREGKITQFIVRPIGYYGYRFSQETSYQIIKTVMMLPALAIMVWLFRDYIQFPPMSAGRIVVFTLSALLAYGLLTQVKFLLGISAFWIAEPGGFLEIWNLLTGIFAGRLLPLALLPAWLVTFGNFLPFASMYAFPMTVLLEEPSTTELLTGFGIQIVWLVVLSLGVRAAWNRGLLHYEAYGG